jgi:hypothetical protein
MQLRTARLCMDCEEIHDQPQCPLCGSETFAYVIRWIPAPERRSPARPSTDAERVEAYQQLLGSGTESKMGKWTKRGVWGAAALLATGWIWSRRSPGGRSRSSETSTASKAGVGSE